MTSQEIIEYLKTHAAFTAWEYWTDSTTDNVVFGYRHGALAEFHVGEIQPTRGGFLVVGSGEGVAYHVDQICKVGWFLWKLRQSKLDWEKASKWMSEA